MEEPFLNNPSYLELDDTYRGLVKWQCITVKTTMPDTVLRDMERIGFVGMKIEPESNTPKTQIIKAFKGKHGPCHFTGWHATYTGAAFAALDDDNHLVSSDRSIAICNKTHAIYSLPPYLGLIRCENVEAETDFPEDIKSNREGEDFELSLEKLYDRLKGVPQNGESRKVLFYPGPFRMLILKDGSIVRRGEGNSVPVSLVVELKKKDGLFEQPASEKVEPDFFQDIFKQQGSSALLKDFNPQQVEQPDFSTDYSALASISKTLRTRLLKMLDENKKYFVLIGNEAHDTLGCCPSEEVTEANSLVKYGILDAFREPVQGDACPVTLYAFRNELQATTRGLLGEPDDEFRKKIRSALGRSTHYTLKQIVKWILLAFILISTVLAIRKCTNQRFTAADEQMIVSQLNLKHKDQVQVLLFHNEKRCYQCLEMEKFTSEVLNVHFTGQLADERLVFKTIVIDDPENSGLVSRFGIFAATLVLVRVDQKEEVIGRVLLDATRFYTDETAFKKYVKKEVEHFLKEANE